MGFVNRGSTLNPEQIQASLKKYAADLASHHAEADLIGGGPVNYYRNFSVVIRMSLERGYRDLHG